MKWRKGEIELKKIVSADIGPDALEGHLNAGIGALVLGAAVYRLFVNTAAWIESASYKNRNAAALDGTRDRHVDAAAAQVAAQIVTIQCEDATNLFACI